MYKKQCLVILLVLSVLLCGCRKDTTEETQSTVIPAETSTAEITEATKAVEETVSRVPTEVEQVLPDMELEDTPESTVPAGTAQKPAETTPKETEAAPTAPAKEEPASPRQNGSNDTWDNEL